MSDIDDVLDDAFHACHEPQPEECALCAARLELAQLRRAKEALQTINGDLRCNADSRSRGGMTLVETWRIERARAILAEIDGKEPTDGK